MKGCSKTQRRNLRRRAKRAARREEESGCPDESHDEPHEEVDFTGEKVQTQNGRRGIVVKHDHNDKDFEIKVEFEDGEIPVADWFKCADLQLCNDIPDDESDGELYDLPTDSGPGDEHGLEEIAGGIGIDSCASDNVMARRHLRAYQIKSSEGSRRDQKWGSASGHSIANEGEVTYRFMMEDGKIGEGTTQVGEVRRPLAAVSKITKAGKIAFFSQGEDWLIDKKDPIALEILNLVRKAKRKTRMYEHKGTYRVRAWMIPGKTAEDKMVTAPFGRQGP